MATVRIPPLQCLQAFEALCRLRSVSVAAEELSVTPSAISHRIRQLETHLGARLFTRNDFTPSADAAAYLVHVRQALTALRHMPGQPVRDDTPARLRLAVTPTFSHEILMPRLSAFRRAWPDIELTVQVAIPLRDVTAEESDLEIRFGTGPYRDVEQRMILSDEVAPLCSPDFAAEFGPFDERFETLEEITRVRLIRSPLEPWSTWFAAHNLTLPEPREGTQFNDVGMMLDAAAAGFGVTLARLKLAAASLASGRLVRLSPRSVPSPHHHFLCWKPGTLERWECAAFADWLQRALV